MCTHTWGQAGGGGQSARKPWGTGAVFVTGNLKASWVSGVSQGLRALNIKMSPAYPGTLFWDKRVCVGVGALWAESVDTSGRRRWEFVRDPDSATSSTSSAKVQPLPDLPGCSPAHSPGSRGSSMPLPQPSHLHQHSLLAPGGLVLASL